MRILVFEFMVGGGVADQHPLGDELQTFFRQGHAMLKAVCQDLLLLGHDVVVPVDVHAETSLPGGVIHCRVEHESDVDGTLVGAADQSDHILLIAPESEGCLEHYAGLLSGFSNRLISPNIEFIRLTGDKWKCHNWYSQGGVACPHSILLNQKCEIDTLPDDFFPCVAKPVDGAGSEDVRLIQSAQQLERIQKPVLLQRFARGVPASVSVIVESPNKVHYLEPGRQVFDDQPFGVHLRTEYPLESNLRERALTLARKVVDASPDVTGYFGIDMVLGEDADDDVLIEINPRLTTSYCYLREWSNQNLAELFPL